MQIPLYCMHMPEAVYKIALLTYIASATDNCNQINIIKRELHKLVTNRTWKCVKYHVSS